MPARVDGTEGELVARLDLAESAAALARELGVSSNTILNIKRKAA